MGCASVGSRGGPATRNALAAASISLVITAIGTFLLFVVGARVYAGAVLQTAGRMKIRDAWRSAGE